MDFGEIIFLDTTFVLPFFQVPIDIKNFDKRFFEKTLRKFQVISLSEISLIEILTKITKLYFREIVDENIFKIFVENLKILRDDERFIIKVLTDKDVDNYKYLLNLEIDLNPIDRLILAQGVYADIFLTEDKDILKIGVEKKFRKKFSVKIVDWKNYISFFE